MNELETQLKVLIIDTLKLEGMAPADIASEEALFVDGLGLDSIDALELGVALRKAFGIQFDSDAEDLKSHFHSVRSLGQFVMARRTI